MVKNIPASAHPAICHRWRAARPCQTYAPHGSPLPGTGQPWTLTSTTGPRTGGFPSTGATCSRHRCRHRGRVEGPGLPEPRALGAFGAAVLPGAVSPLPGQLSPAPSPSERQVEGAALCSAVPRGWLPGSASSWHSSGQAQLALPTGSAPSAGAPALSSPRGCLAPGLRVVYPSAAGAELPSAQERNACRDTGHCRTGIQGTRRAGTQGIAMQGHRALLCRDRRCTLCRGHAVPHPPCLHAALPSTSAGRAASPQVSWQRPHLLLSTIRRLLRTRGI